MLLRGLLWLKAWSLVLAWGPSQSVFLRRAADWFKGRTVCLVVLALAVDIAVAALAILRVALALTAVLWIVALLGAIVSLLVLGPAIASWDKGLSGLEGCSSR